MCKTIEKEVRNYLEIKTPLTTIKGYRSLAGMVNFLGFFSSELQKLFKQYLIQPEKVNSLFVERNNKMVLKKLKEVCKNHHYYIIQIINLYSDTSNLAKRSALHQILNDKSNLKHTQVKECLKQI